MADLLLAGQIVAHFKILSRLGAGGMGEVYLAEDVRLGRRVALKVLPPSSGPSGDLVDRFGLEARAASALNHPNILTIYDIGEAGSIRFMAAEFIEGETLRARLDRGALEIVDALDITTQVAGALAAAHDAGIVHRDVKPENVMLRRDGYVKVLDFGLAKLVEPAGPDVAAQTVAATSAGLILGTCRYMSPEQARGQTVDARSDVFSLGIVLYEMIAGAAPFTGSTAADVLGAILFLDPPVPAGARPIPGGLARIVERAMRKQKDDRYATMHELLADVKEVRRDIERSVATARAAGVSQSLLVAEIPAPSARRRRRRTIDSVAVLPLVNAGGDPDVEYLSDGITETIINNLSQVSKLRVMARSTVFRYKGREVDPLSAGRELNVRAVLTGRLQQRGGALVISVELVDVEDGSQLWGGQFSRQGSQAFELQDEISNDLLERLRLSPTGDAKMRLARRHAPAADAYEAYLKGRYFLNKRTAAGFSKAIEHFEDAIAKDGDYAPAYAGLADAYALDAATSYATVALQEAVSKARAAAERAVALDPTLAEAHASMAFIKTRFDWDWAGAETAYRRALELNPGHAASHHGYGMFLGTMGRFHEALRVMGRAQERDPLSLVVACGIGRILHLARRFDDAIAQYRRVLEMDPQYARVRFDLGLALAASGAHEEALQELQKAGELSGSRTWAVLLVSLAHALAGRRAEARAGAGSSSGTTKKGSWDPASWRRSTLPTATRIARWNCWR